MEPTAILEKIRAALPDAEVDRTDLTGTADHWQARIVSEGFAGVSPVMRHRMIYKALREEMQGPIHALALETLTPEEAKAS